MLDADRYLLICVGFGKENLNFISIGVAKNRSEAVKLLRGKIYADRFNPGHKSCLNWRWGVGVS